jgi:hypothetical protein
VGAKSAIRAGIGDAEKYKPLLDLLIVQKVLLGLIYFPFDEFGDTTGAGTTPTGRGQCNSLRLSGIKDVSIFIHGE